VEFGTAYGSKRTKGSVLTGLSWSLLEHIHKLTSATHAETLFWSSKAAEGVENP